MHPDQEGGIRVRLSFKHFAGRYARALLQDDGGASGAQAPRAARQGGEGQWRELCERILTTTEACAGPLIIPKDPSNALAGRQVATGVEAGLLPWQLGRTRVFLQDDARRELENRANKKTTRYAIIIQSWWRMLADMHAFREQRRAIQIIKSLIQTRLAVQKLEKFRREYDAATSVAAQWRRASQRAKFITTKNASVACQRLMRGALARKRVGNLKDGLAKERAARAQAELQAQEAAATQLKAG